MDNMLDYYIQQMRQDCAIKDSKYWDVRLEEGDCIVRCDNSGFSIYTKEGFIIEIKMLRWGGIYHFNGYVSLPSTYVMHHLISWARQNPDYDDMNYMLDLNVELTYCNIEKLEYGWDHAHGWDADFGRLLTSQPEKHASGPVQVLEEARGVIRSMMDKEKRMMYQKIDEKRVEMELIREELIMKACHRSVDIDMF